MMSPEEQEMHIRMVKASLAKLNTELSDQVALTVEMDEETEKLFEQFKAMSLEHKRLNEECEDYKQTNLKLLAKRMELKRKCDANERELKYGQEEAATNFQLLYEQRAKNQKLILQYEDTMCEYAKELREMAFIYKKREVREKINEIKKYTQELKEEKAELDESIQNIKDKMQNITRSVPDDILDIIGKTALETKLQNLIDEIEELNKECKKEP